MPPPLYTTADVYGFPSEEPCPYNALTEVLWIAKASGWAKAKAKYDACVTAGVKFPCSFKVLQKSTSIYRLAPNENGECTRKLVHRDNGLPFLKRTDYAAAVTSVIQAHGGAASIDTIKAELSKNYHYVKGWISELFVDPTTTRNQGTGQQQLGVPPSQSLSNIPLLPSQPHGNVPLLGGPSSASFGNGTSGNAFLLDTTSFNLGYRMGEASQYKERHEEMKELYERQYLETKQQHESKEKLHESKEKLYESKEELWERLVASEQARARAAEEARARAVEEASRKEPPSNEEAIMAKLDDIQSRQQEMQEDMKVVKVQTAK